MSPSRLVGIRGATTVERDTRDEIFGATQSLLTEMLDANGLGADDLVSIWFTATPDLHAAYPATAARDLGLTDVALLGAQEMDVEGGMPRVIRVLLHAYSAATPRHVFQRRAVALRPDLAEDPA